ncbi:MAG: tetratricopeptide repeat protein, partial [Thermoanaerobaculia bacterium]|nr:tetratricopeptide repeat protein [Thermoanaerobaculia bacterium]
VLDSADWGFLMRPEAQQWGILHYVMLTSSLSAVGKHERELTEARKAGGTFGSLLACRLMEARALASLGRFDELNALIDASLSEGGSDAIMVHAGNRLNAAGHPGEATTIWNRAVSWIQNRPLDEAKARRGTLANALINAGRLDEAERLVREEKRLLEAPATERPIGSDAARIRADAQIGVIAALRGDRATAIAVSERIGKLNGPYLFGATHYERARIAGRLGDREESVRLLRAAIADGFFAWNYPRGVFFRDEPSFDSLRGYEPFEELARPKG